MCGNPLGRLSDLARLITPQVITPTVQSTSAVAPQITCVRCHAQVNPGYEWCPHCGAALHAMTCTYCGESIKAGLDDCPLCGAPDGGTRRNRMLTRLLRESPSKLLTPIDYLSRPH